MPEPRPTQIDENGNVKLRSLRPEEESTEKPASRPQLRGFNIRKRTLNSGREETYGELREKE